MSSAVSHFHTDVLIVGAGGAGLSAALSAARHGLSVTVLSKVPPTQSHTVAAQGGMNAALATVSEDDWRWHAYDTIKGSDFLADQDAVALMCREAPAAIAALEHMGMPFSRHADGRIYQRVYGGQSSHFGEGKAPERACAVADRTGHSLIHTLYTQALKHRVRVIEPFMAVDLIRSDSDSRVVGVIGIHTEAGAWQCWNARAVILATGGFGHAFATSTASSICTGDGGGMALRAGIALQDMEFVQFHPTGLYGKGFLITEAARAEGGVLLNGLGERFMERYAPQFLDLAARDVIARAMAQEILEGRGAGADCSHILLSLAHLSSELLTSRLPTVLETARHFAGIDARSAAIPVVPTVHYTMGGIPTTLNAQVLDAEQREVPGLYAIGEAACASVHGANRLGCNGLLELVVFGKRAGDHIASSVRVASSMPTPSPISVAAARARIECYMSSHSDIRPASLRLRMQRIMDRHAGVFREASLLQHGIDALRELLPLVQEMRVSSPSLFWNDELRDALELENLLPQSLLVLSAALHRTESRGSHYRNDFPDRNDALWLHHSRAWLDDSGRVELTQSPVRMLTGMDEFSTVTPISRRY